MSILFRGLCNPSQILGVPRFIHSGISFWNHSHGQMALHIYHRFDLSVCILNHETVCILSVYNLFCLSLACYRVMRSFTFVRQLNNEDCRVAFTASRGHRLLMQDSCLRGRNQCGRIYLAVLALQGFRGTSQCLLFTFDKDMSILAECCPTHCILHHH